MAGAVPVARRNFFQERRRTALSVGGVGAALLLVLVLDGIFAGAMRQVSAYVDRSPAAAIVSQKGVRTMHMSASALPEETVDAARRVPGAAWAEGIRFVSGVVRTSRGRRLSYVIGYDVRTGRGGPRRLVSGRAPRRGEAVVDRAAAEELGIRPGSAVEVLGRTYRVSGLSEGGTSIVNTTAFVPFDDLAGLRGTSVNYVLVGTARGVPPGTLARRLRRALPAATVQTREEFSAQERSVVRDMSADVMAIMTVVGLLIALAVVGLTLFTATLAKLREYGVLKALGARPGRLAGIVLSQAAWSVALALLLALALTVVVAAVVAAATPNVRLAIEPGGVLRTGAEAALVGALGSVVPLRRVLGVDPASVFRRQS